MAVDNEKMDALCSSVGTSNNDFSSESNHVYATAVNG